MIATCARSFSMGDRMDYRVALILPVSRQLMAAKVDDIYWLPQISIPLGERCAEQLTRVIEERWRIKSIVLDLVLDDCPDSPCAIIEIRTSLSGPSTEGLATVDLDKVSDQSLRLNERRILHSILLGRDSGRGPFSRI